MDALQRKIELQSPPDLTYIQENINKVAQQELDLHVPSSAAPGDEEDAFRTKVEGLVQQYIKQTLSLALPSISINGLDAAPSLDAPLSNDEAADALNPIDPNDPSYEPYDASLAEKLRSLYAALEGETTKVAELRREAPAKAAQAFAGRLAEDVAAREVAMEDARMRAREEGAKRSQVLGVKFERAERVKDTWGKANDRLEDLRGVTEAVARLERAKRAAEEVERL